MAARLAQRLGSARHGHFVGRDSERALLETALSAAEWPFCVLHVSGLGGVGKTSLLREYSSLCTTRGVETITLDARNIEPEPEAFLVALSAACGLVSQDSTLQFLSNRTQRFVLFIDTYERLGPLDDWLRDSFLPQLSDKGLVVLAGRNPPLKAWRVDAAWSDLLRILPLRNLNPQESRSFLTGRGVPAEQHDSIVDFTFGHPLALSLVADLFAQEHFAAHRTSPFTLKDAPDVVQVLVEHLVHEVPGSAHRAALEIVSLVRVTTEALLAELLAQPWRAPVSQQDEEQQEPTRDTLLRNTTVHELFEWLRSLSFIEAGAAGIFPHDLAREALVTDLRWRDPEWYAEIHRRARTFYASRLKTATNQEQQRILIDYIFLHRANSVVRPFLEWQEHSGMSLSPAQRSDIPALLAIVEQHEGAESARLAAHWFDRQIEGALVLREAHADKGRGHNGITGFLMHIALHRASAQDLEADPATHAAWEYLQQHAPLRPGEGATHFRLWMARDTYQDVSSAQSLIFVNIVRHYLTTPKLAFTFLPVADTAFWEPVFSYANARHIPEAGFTVDERSFGVYSHDWRSVPPLSWLALMADRETTTSGNEVKPQPAAPLIVLSEPEFGEAAQKALRNMTRPASLRGNPLLRSRLVAEQVDESTAHANTAESARLTALQAIIKAACEELRVSPRHHKFYEALYYAYLQPAPTQERAAKLMDVPFSSFRRYLKSGSLMVIEILWRQEIGG